MSEPNRRREDMTNEEKAAHGDGQDQSPKQAQDDSSTLWDTDQHSDAPGPFGTGEK